MDDYLKSCASELAKSVGEEGGELCANVKVEGVQPGLYGKYVLELSARAASEARVGAPISLDSIVRGVVCRVEGSSLFVSGVSYDERLVELISRGSAVLRERTDDRAADFALESLSLVSEHSFLKALFATALTDSPQVQMNDSRLNEFQSTAVCACLGAHHVVHGPPGTGKTTTIAGLIRECMRLKQRVLVCAPSNLAVDNVVESIDFASGESFINRMVRLGNPTRITNEAMAHSLDEMVERRSDSIRQAREELSKLLNSKNIGKGFWKRKRDLEREIRKRHTKIVSELVANSAIVACTLSGAVILDKHKPKFDVLIVDEASQALDAYIWGAARFADRVVLAGDHMQLEPFSFQKLTMKTLMERAVESAGVGCTLLKAQYRMHRDIGSWASERFYSGQLVHRAEESDQFAHALCWIDTKDVADSETQVDSSYCNETEVSVISRMRWEGDVKIIAPYRAQVERLKAAVPHLEIGTVDGFQGREADVVVISCVRSNDDFEIGFLANEKRLNVAVTRAKRRLIVVGDSRTVTRASPAFKSLYDHISELGEVLRADEVDAAIEYDPSAFAKRLKNRVVVGAKLAMLTESERELVRKQAASLGFRVVAKGDALSVRGAEVEEVAEAMVGEVAEATVGAVAEATVGEVAEGSVAGATIAEASVATSSSTASAASLAPPPAPAQTTRRRKKKKKKKPPVVESDDDVLDAAIRANSRCGVCAKKHTITSLKCPVCKRKFCIPHVQPEVHGCDTARFYKAKK